VISRPSALRRDGNLHETTWCGESQGSGHATRTYTNWHIYDTITYNHPSQPQFLFLYYSSTLIFKYICSPPFLNRSIPVSSNSKFTTDLPDWRMLISPQGQSCSRHHSISQCGGGNCCVATYLILTKHSYVISIYASQR
jgi:hypothetical protein